MSPTLFYYDTAQASHPMALASLTQLIPVSQIVFGTDYPYRTAADHVKGPAAGRGSRQNAAGQPASRSARSPLVP